MRCFELRNAVLILVARSGIESGQIFGPSNGSSPGAASAQSRRFRPVRIHEISGEPENNTVRERLCRGTAVLHVLVPIDECEQKRAVVVRCG